MREREHGTTRSYVVGFILSLVFTAIPYYLVVNKTIAGTALVGTILGIAILQMLIQIVFFLHLGRGSKPFYNVIFFGITVTAIVVVVGGSLWIMNHLNYNMAATDVAKYLAEKEGISQVGGQKTGACDGIKADHKVTIRDGVVSPSRVNARYCDTLIIVNEDDQVRKITFGSYPAHGSYGGESEVTVSKGRPRTVILNEPGDYAFHDQLDPRAAGSFSVAR